MNELFRDEMKEIFLEPAKLLISRLEEVKEYLNTEEKIMLEKLKFSVNLYEIRREGMKYEFKGFDQNF
jgi:hypothetical protein